MEAIGHAGTCLGILANDGRAGFLGRVIVGYFSTLRAPLSEFTAGKPMISLGLCKIDF
jgi:hypothetical protein